MYIYIYILFIRYTYDIYTYIYDVINEYVVYYIILLFNSFVRITRRLYQKLKIIAFYKWKEYSSKLDATRKLDSYVAFLR